ncbi:unnamed protein product [Owenia fusiformis]|uniref:Uncharacterized protein n=1 Tax=Owenia fusiformis TaxID=6347 RepID=A0A8J1UTG8_OWEFU|nr:unnamed protein product [Owenia fusiformis]
MENITEKIDEFSADAMLFKNASMYVTFQIGYYIHLVTPGVILAFGSAGNILSFLVMVQKRNICRTTCLYMAALAVADNITLVCLATYWIVTCFQTDTSVHTNTILCKVFAYISQTCSEFSIFVLGAMTIDRYVAIRFPMRSTTLCTIQRTRVILISGLLTLGLYNIPIPWMTGVHNRNLCAAFFTKNTQTVIYSWIYICMCTIIPFCSLLTFNYLIISAIHRHKRELADLSANMMELTSKTDGGSKYFRRSHFLRKSRLKNSRENQLTAMLLFVTFTFLALTLPQYIRYIVYADIHFKESAKEYALNTLLYHISNKLWFSNSAVNFYLYCLCGSKFRSDLKKLFPCYTGKTVSVIYSQSQTNASL